MAKFTVVIEQDEDGAYCASVPSLPGCVSAGSSYDEALANAKVAVELHVEVLREHGDPLPPPRIVGIEDIVVAL